MGAKVNFNNKKNNKPRIIGIVILILLLIMVVIINLKGRASNDNSNQQTPTRDAGAHIDFKTLDELLESYGCKLLDRNESNGLVTINLTFKHDLYTGNTSNKNYFSRLCNAVAIFEDYRNITMNDSSKDIKIEITCSGNRIAGIIINDDPNYFQNQDSIRNKNLSTNITEFTIQSQELNDLINNNWDETKVNFGTKDSTCGGYNIYFDEGIKYKVVARNIFNIVFTENYKGQVAGALKTTSNKNQVENALGKPTFSDDSETIYGYKGENNYLFFDFNDKQISIYPVLEISKDDENKLKELIEKMNETSDVKQFVSDLLVYWPDYDVYDYDSNYVDLRYTLKGFSVSTDSRVLQNGIYIYQNYSGNRNITDLKTVYLKETDFVFDEEVARIQNEFLNRVDQGEISDDQENSIGEKFSVRATYMNDDGLRGVQFYSRNYEYPDVELDKSIEISSWKWFDEYNFVYAVNGEGVYAFNCYSQETVKLVDNDAETITINRIEDNKIIYNDTEEIEIYK